MQERFRDRVSLQWDIPAATLQAGVPAFLLQPLLENAFRHGVEKRQDPVVIRIDSRRDGEQIWLTIANTGVLDFSAPTGGIGLRNCRERLHVHYGAAATLELRQEGSDVLARVRLPWREVES